MKKTKSQKKKNHNKFLSNKRELIEETRSRNFYIRKDESNLSSTYSNKGKIV